VGGSLNVEEIVGINGRSVFNGDAHQLSIELDYGEKVVEIVSDSPGKLTDSLHLLGLPELLLQNLQLRDVLNDHLECHDVACSIV